MYYQRVTIKGVIAYCQGGLGVTQYSAILAHSYI